MDKTAKIENEKISAGLAANGGYITHWQLNGLPIMPTSWCNPFMPQKSGSRGEFVTGSWPMIPYPGRIRDLERGVFRWRGRMYSCGDESYRQEYAIHGPACRFPWEISCPRKDLIEARFEHYKQEEAIKLFPISFSASQQLWISDTTINGSLRIENKADTCMPAALGAHHFWMHSPRGIEGERAEIQFAAFKVWPKEDGILLPSAKPVEVAQELCFAAWKTLPLGLDHCFILSGDTVKIRWPQSRIRVTIRTGAKYVVIYSPEKGGNNGLFDGTFALELQTSASNAIGLCNSGVEEHGLTELQPGQSMSLNWQATAEMV